METTRFIEDEVQEEQLPISQNIVVWPSRQDLIVDESLIPVGKEPSVYDPENGLNMPRVYDASWEPE